MYYFFFNDTATTEIYTLSLHDALPILVIDSLNGYLNAMPEVRFLTLQLHELLTYLGQRGVTTLLVVAQQDRKSTRLNSSHANISYAVFCLKKKIHTYIYYHHICSTLLR